MARGWIDYDNFSAALAHRIADTEPKDGSELAGIIKKLSSPFFELNHISRESFIRALPSEDILAAIKSQSKWNLLTFIDIFDETSKVGVEEGKQLREKLEDLDERIIQNELRNSLREKNVMNAVEREHESPLEVGDLEHFVLKIGKTPRSFVAVVKGYKSVSGKTVTWEQIAHQITKAYNRTQPDHVLLILAKNPADTLVSESTQYGKTVRKPGLVVLCDPVTLARFLKARNAI